MFAAALILACPPFEKVPCDERRSCATCSPSPARSRRAAHRVSTPPTLGSFLSRRVDRPRDIDGDLAGHRL